MIEAIKVIQWDVSLLNMKGRAVDISIHFLF